MTTVRRSFIEADVVEVKILRIGTREIACLLSRSAAALLLGVSGDTVDREYKAGEIARVYVRDTPMYKLEDLLEYIERRRRYYGDGPR